MNMTILGGAFAFAVLLANVAGAAELAMPTGPVILTVEGHVLNSNGDGKASFDLSMLDALPQRTTVSVTPWYPQEEEFSGVIIRDLLAAAGATGTMVTVTALNDYSADIPMEDFMANPVILASRVDGNELSVRDKGPLFVIYPFDLDPDLYNEVFFSRSVWQVKSITVH